MDTITATRHRAVGQAAIILFKITIIAALKPIDTLLEVSPLDAITAGCCRARVQAAVKVITISIVARFNALVNRTIAASRRTAPVGTSIRIKVITVVAQLTQLRVNDPIATALHFTAIGAAVCVHVVAVVTALIALFALADICTQHAVTAGSELAGSEAAIAIKIVAIIAGFGADGPLAKVVTNDPIAAAGFGASIRAFVSVDIIAVVAGLALLAHAIAAARLTADRSSWAALRDQSQTR
jgi:hypothetical protein